MKLTYSRFITKRLFLKIAGYIALLIPLTTILWAIKSFLLFQRPRNTIVLTKGQLPAPGALIHAKDQGLFISRDIAGYFALRDKCTHLGCTVDFDQSGIFICPCHHSKFDKFGNRISGPAAAPLTSVYIYKDSKGDLVAEYDRVVNQSFRLVE